MKGRREHFITLEFAFVSMVWLLKLQDGTYEISLNAGEREKLSYASQFYVDLTQTRVILEKGTPTEESTPSRLACLRVCEHFIDSGLVWKGPAQRR